MHRKLLRRLTMKGNEFTHWSTIVRWMMNGREQKVMKTTIPQPNVFDIFTPDAKSVAQAPLLVF